MLAESDGEGCGRGLVRPDRGQKGDASAQGSDVDGHICRHPPTRNCSSLDRHNGYRGFWRNALGFPAPIAVQHHIADHQGLDLGEIGQAQVHRNINRLRSPACTGCRNRGIESCDLAHLRSAETPGGGSSTDWCPAAGSGGEAVWDGHFAWAPYWASQRRSGAWRCEGWAWSVHECQPVKMTLRTATDDILVLLL